MSLIAIREQVARLSGRHDLVADFAGEDYSNAGNGDWFINQGQRLLDRKASFAKRFSWYKKDIEAGDYKLNFKYCSAIKQVWAMNADNDRYQLYKRDLNWMRRNYGEAYSDLTQGSPVDYSPLIVNLGPDQVSLKTTDYTDEFTYDFEEILFSDTADHFYYTGVLFMPPADEKYTISILGRFWSPPLSSDSQKTFWTEVHPDLLVIATLYSIERFYRNTEGMNDYMASILDAVADLDKDEVEQEIQDVDSMEG